MVLALGGVYLLNKLRQGGGHDGDLGVELRRCELAAILLLVQECPRVEHFLVRTLRPLVVDVRTLPDLHHDPELREVPVLVRGAVPALSLCQACPG